MLVRRVIFGLLIMAALSMLSACFVAPVFNGGRGSDSLLYSGPVLAGVALVLAVWYVVTPSCPGDDSPPDPGELDDG